MNVVLLKEIITSRRKTVVMLVVILAINAGLYLYYTLYQAPQLIAMQNKVFSSRRASVGGLPQDAMSIYQRGMADLATWEKKIPEKKEFVRVVGELMSTAKTNKLSIGAISYIPITTKGEKRVVYNIKISVSGKYGGVKSFICDVGRMRDVVVVDNISLNNSKMTEEYVDLRLELSAYFRVEG